MILIAVKNLLLTARDMLNPRLSADFSCPTNNGWYNEARIRRKYFIEQAFLPEAARSCVCAEILRILCNAV